ncbi:unnamed protein product [Urochloa decumbens]|uniref:Uncharacterized protein n=1 Tax=Urochloa decumbens TaxID=240449 RepID=A0ABC9EJQ4_9POAL
MVLDKDSKELMCPNGSDYDGSHPSFADPVISTRGGFSCVKQELEPHEETGGTLVETGELKILWKHGVLRKLKMSFARLCMCHKHLKVICSSSQYMALSHQIFCKKLQTELKDQRLQM